MPSKQHERSVLIAHCICCSSYAPGTFYGRLCAWSIGVSCFQRCQKSPPNQERLISLSLSMCQWNLKTLKFPSNNAKWLHFSEVGGLGDRAEWIGPPKAVSIHSRKPCPPVSVSRCVFQSHRHIDMGCCRQVAISKKWKTWKLVPFFETTLCISTTPLL